MSRDFCNRGWGTPTAHRQFAPCILRRQMHRDKGMQNRHPGSYNLCMCHSYFASRCFWFVRRKLDLTIHREKKTSWYLILASCRGNSACRRTVSVWSRIISAAAPQSTAILHLCSSCLNTEIVRYYYYIYNKFERVVIKCFIIASYKLFDLCNNQGQ